MHSVSSPFKELFIPALLLGALGFAVNWLNPPLFFGVNALFGSLFVMIALLRYGTGAGIMAGFIAGSYTWIFWGHPWGLMVFLGEAWFVGRMLRRSRNVILLDTLYWLCIGIPFVLSYRFLLLHSDLSLSLLLALKVGVNDICNTVTAALLLHLLSIVPFSRRGPEQLPSFHHLLVTFMVATILIPGCSYIIFEIRRDMAQEEEQVRTRFQSTTSLTRQLMENWLSDKIHDVKTLTTMVGDPQTVPPARIQGLAELMKRASPHFVRMSVQNSKAVSVAFVPSRDDQGHSNVGRDYSHMPYHRIVRDTLKPAVSDIDYGTISKGPRLALFAPIVIDGVFRGYCTGVVEITSLAEQLRIVSRSNAVAITLLDRKRQVVASTDPALRMMTHLDPTAGHELRWLRGKVYQLVPRRGAANDLESWQQASFGMDSPLNADVPWSIVLSAPMQPYLKEVQDNASRSFALLLVLTLFSIVSAQVASTAFVRPIVRLEQLSAALPAGLIRQQEAPWPQSGIREVAGLIDNFRQMAASLQNNFSELQTLNESLERRVEERTEDIRRLNEELEARVSERTAQLQEALQHMESFSYSISHDLRAPLRALNGYAHILVEDFGPVLPPEAQAYLDKISGNGTRMAALIDDLLSFSRLSRHPLLKEAVDTASLVHGVLEETESDRKERTVQITVGELPPCVADPSLLRQIFVNLLSNALKYTRRRENARIEVGSLRQGKTVIYFVRDNGDGFDMAYAGKLFGVFQRLHRDEDFEGTGVGLAIVHNIVTRHGGTIRAEAAPGEGATFFFTVAEG
ncbi:histidine kinase [Geobacter pickeringii]|uniref:histidine kinase n=2 Tax=Geobacter pickeringii TaxID=345632 RepID=A0A0B5BD24_9BACT|nr:histidine kinase [Geobacter pickeringii]